MKSGDDEAARRIWDRYSPRLAALAKERLPVGLHCIVSGDDVANSALRSVIIERRDGRLPQLHGRDDLWAILACVTVRKAINEAKKANRQKRRSSGENVAIDENIVGSEPQPDLARTAAEHFERLIDCLHKKDELLETIAHWKFEGYTSEEIARRLGCSSRRVARKLDLICMTWEAENLQ
jgi:DNA-directed RNA polymerase specialized sigma24 family protein